MSVLHSYSPGASDESARDFSGVEETVRRWWSAWGRGDIEAIEALALEEYMEYTGGPSGAHRVGRMALVAEARETVERFSIVRWSLAGLQILRSHDDFAVVGYRWELSTRKGDGEVRFAGVATDVLVRTGQGWRYLAHHSTRETREHGSLDGPGGMTG